MTQMVKVHTQHGTITEMTNTGSITVQLNDTLADVYMLASDFKTAPRMGQRVTLETCFNHTVVAS
jgi:hypothetical protein